MKSKSLITAVVLLLFGVAAYTECRGGGRGGGGRSGGGARGGMVHGGRAGGGSRIARGGRGVHGIRHGRRDGRFGRRGVGSAVVLAGALPYAYGYGYGYGDGCFYDEDGRYICPVDGGYSII